VLFEMEPNSTTQCETLENIQPPSNFKIIGCGKGGSEIVHQLQTDHKDDFCDIEIVNFDRALSNTYHTNPPQDPHPQELTDDQNGGPDEEPSPDEQPPEPGETDGTAPEMTLGDKFRKFILSLRNLFSKSPHEPTPPEDENVKVEDPNEPQDLPEPAQEEAPAVAEPLQEPLEPERDHSEELRALIRDSSVELKGIDIAFLICNLEGEGDLENAEVVINTAQELEVMNIVIVELTSSFDKIDDVHIANRVLQKLRLIADIVVVVPEISKIGLWYLVQSIQELMKLITTPGLVNLDLADLKNIVKGGNVALLGFGEAEGEERVTNALRHTLTSPLLQVDLEAVERALVNVTGGENMTLEEAERVSDAIRQKIKSKSRIIFGATVDHKAQDQVKVMLMVGATPMQVLINAYSQT
jgi:cell division GTPase FtsZ